MLWELSKKNYFEEIYVKTPLSLEKRRNPKKLYLKTWSVNIPNLTGLTSPHEATLAPVNSFSEKIYSVDDLADQLLARLI